MFFIGYVPKFNILKMYDYRINYKYNMIVRLRCAGLIVYIKIRLAFKRSYVNLFNHTYDTMLHSTATLKYRR